MGWDFWRAQGNREESFSKLRKVPLHALKKPSDCRLTRLGNRAFPSLPRWRSPLPLILASEGQRLRLLPADKDPDPEAQKSPDVGPGCGTSAVQRSRPAKG